MDGEHRVSWARTLLTGLAVGMVLPIGVYIFFWPRDMSDFVMPFPCAAAGVAAALVVRGLGLGRRLTAGRFVTGVLLGTGAGSLAGLLVARAVVSIPSVIGDMNVIFFTAMATVAAALTAVLCPYLWSKWLARQGTRL